MDFKAGELMGTVQQSWRLAIAGLGPRGQFFRERWRLLNPERVVALADDNSQQRQAIGATTIPMVPLAELSHHPGDCTAVLVTVPLSDRGPLIADCLSSGLSVLVEPPLATTLAEARRLLELAHSHGVALRVMGLRRSEPDFLAATAALGTGRIGSLGALRWYTAEYAVWAGDAAAEYRRGETLTVAGPPIFDQLAGLTNAVPRTVWARAFLEEDCFATDITFEDGSTARIELRRMSRVSMRTGWVIEGDTGTYHQRRIITTTADGELVDEAVPLSGENPDPLTELEAMHVLAPLSGEEQRRSLVAAGLIEATQRSIHTGLPVSWDML